MRRHLNRIALGTVSGATVLNLITILCGVGSGVTLARSLGPDSRGDLAAALLWPNLLVLFADMGLGFAFAYGAAKWRERLDDLWTLSLLIGTVLGVIAVLTGLVLLPRLAGNLSAGGHLGMKIALCSVPFILTAGYQALLLLGMQHVAAYNAFRVIGPLSNLVTVALVAGTGRAGVVSYSIAFLATQALAFLFCTTLFWARLRPSLHLCFDLVPGLFPTGSKRNWGVWQGRPICELDQSGHERVAGSGKTWPLCGGRFNQRNRRSLAECAGRLCPASHGSREFGNRGRSGRGEASKAGVGLVNADHPVLDSRDALDSTGFFGRSYLPAVKSAQLLAVASLIHGLNAIMGNRSERAWTPGALRSRRGSGNGDYGAASLLFVASAGNCRRGHCFSVCVRGGCDPAVCLYRARHRIGFEGSCPCGDFPGPRCTIRSVFGSL